MSVDRPRSIDELWMILRKRLAESHYQGKYKTEMAFESDVWRIVVNLATELGLEAASTCLTSHAALPGKSTAAWKEFCSGELGPDVNVLGSNNRLDIVFRDLEYGSIGIEVKCLGSKGHAAKLTQGIGQAVLALAHRDRTLLVIHCGTLSNAERQRLREISERMCDGTRTAVIVVPGDPRTPSEERARLHGIGDRMSSRDSNTDSTGWIWEEDTVDLDGEHFELRYGDVNTGGYEDWTPIAIIGKPRGRVFPVMWLMTPPEIDKSIIQAVREELDFYLVDKCEPNPWEYAIYHCGTGANIYSKVHWSYFPAKRKDERY